MIRAKGCTFIHALLPSLAPSLQGPVVLFRSASISTAQQSNASVPAFNESVLAYLVCPLAKTPLRYDRQQQLLINDDLGVGYPIVDGVPYLIPAKGMVLQQVAQHRGGPDDSNAST